jgi:hypothetical protein
MAAEIGERPNSRPFTVSREPSDERSLHYWVKGTNDEVEVETLLQLTAPATYPGTADLIQESYRVEPHEDGFSWDCVVNYALERIKYVRSFDTTGGTAHVTQSKENIGNYALNAPPDTAPDYEGAINVVDADNVEGVDIPVGSLVYQEVHVVDADYIDVAYMKLVRRLSGKTNLTTFRGFEIGEMLFKGATGGERNKDKWELTFKWDINEEDPATIDIGDDISIPGTDKKPWFYLWVHYDKKKDDVATRKKLIRRPDSAHIERLFDAAEFRDLFPWPTDPPEPPPPP